MSTLLPADDVGYRCNPRNTGRSREIGALLSSMGEGVRRDDSSRGVSQGSSGSGGGGQGRGRGGGASSQECSAEPGVPSRHPRSSTPSSSGPGGSVGSGPGNMPSSISVQELKQMTALRMAHEQGRMRVFSPFRFSGRDGGGEQQQARSRGPSPLRAEPDQETRESGGNSVSNGGNAFQARVQLSRDPGSGNAHGDNPQRPRRQRLESFGTASGDGVAGHNLSPVDIPPTPSSSCSGSSRSGELRSRRSPSPQGRQSPPPPPPPPPLQGSGASSSGSSLSKATPPTSAMPHGLTVQELKELTKMRLAREAFNIPVYAVLHSSSQQPPEAKRGAGGSAPRGRWASSSPSLNKSGRHGERSSTPASPGNGDRPHRRTRRGGRRGRNRSPRPDENLSPKRLSGGSAGEGFSSASPSRRLRRTFSDPWGALDDDHPRSSSQPRAVMGRDHVFPGVNHRGEGGDVGDREADSSVDGGGLQGGDVARESGGESGDAASLRSPEVSPTVGSCGTASPSNSGGAALSLRPDASAFGPRDHSSIPVVLSGRRSPATVSMRADSFDRAAYGFERERKLKLDRALSSERARPTQYVDRRDIAQHARLREKTEGGGGRRVAGMIGPERKTILRGFDPLEDHAPKPPGHHRLALHRASSESILIPTDCDGRAASIPRYGNSQNHHRRADSVHLHVPETGSEGGVVLRGGGSVGRSRGRAVGGGQYVYEHYEPQEQRRHHSHRSSGVGVMDLAHKVVSPALLGEDGFGVDHTGCLMDSQQEEQRQQHAPRSWDGDSSLWLSLQSLPPQAPCLSYRRSDGGAVGSGRGGARKGFSRAGVSCRGGLASPSSSSPFDGIRDDISFNVAEAVLVTPKNPASPPGQWKTNHMQQAAATGSSTGAGAAWCGPTLTSGMMLTSPLSGMLEKEPLGYHGERSQHTYRSSSNAEATVGEDTSSSGNGFRGPPSLQQCPRPSHQPLGPPKTYWSGSVRDSSNNPPPPGFVGTSRFDNPPLQRRGMGVAEVEGQQQQPDPQRRPSPSFLSQSPRRATGARYPSSSSSSVPALFKRNSFSAVEGHVSAATKAKTGNPSDSYTTGSSCSGESRHSSRTPSPSVVGAIGCVTASDSSRPSAASGLGRSGGSGNGGVSPLMSGLNFSLGLAGCAGDSSPGDEAQGYHVGGAASDSRSCSESYSGSEFFGFEFAVDRRGRLVSASPGSLHGSGNNGGGGGGLGGDTHSQPRRVDIGPSFAGVVGAPKLLDPALFPLGRGGQGEEEAVTTVRRRLDRSVSSTAPIGHGRPAGHPGTIGSSRSRGRGGVSGHSSNHSSSPALGANIDRGVVGAALQMPEVAEGRGGGGGDALGSISVSDFLGVY